MIDVDEVLARVRQRVAERRASGAYGREVEAALRLPLPGGRPLFTDELEDPLPALADALEEDVRYDPRSRKGLVGLPITLARRVVMGLLRWWIVAIHERQDRVNRLLAKAVHDLRERPSPGFDARLTKLELEWRRFRSDMVAAELHSVYFQATFGGDEPVVRAQSESFVPLFKGRRRVLDIGSGRGTFLRLLRENAIRGYGVDLDPRMVEETRSKGFEVEQADALEHLRTLEPGELHGVFARHLAEHILPGELVSLLRELRRVLAPGSPVVFVTPNPATLTVGAHTFWLDPQHLRPIPPDLFRFYLEVEGFEQVEVVTSEPSERRLSEDVPEGPQRENARLLNETLFGHRDYAVIGRQPEGVA